MPKPQAKAAPRKKMQASNAKTSEDANAKAQSSRTTAALSPKSRGGEVARGAATANSANVSSNVARTPNPPVPNTAGYQEDKLTSEAKKRDREAHANPALTQQARDSEESASAQETTPAFLEPSKAGKR